MAKFKYTPNPRAQAVMDDLEKYLGFCRDYGYRYNEADLGNWKSYAYQQYNKFLEGKPAKNMWDQLIRAVRGA
jgi:hypothetical protein